MIYLGYFSGALFTILQIKTCRCLSYRPLLNVCTRYRYQPRFLRLFRLWRYRLIARYQARHPFLTTATAEDINEAGSSESDLQARLNFRSPSGDPYCHIPHTQARRSAGCQSRLLMIPWSAVTSLRRLSVPIQKSAAEATSSTEQ